MFETIVVPLDRSPATEVALPAACDLARQCQSRLKAVSVEALLPAPERTGSGKRRRGAPIRAGRYLRKVVAHFEQVGSPLQHEVLPGTEPGPALQEFLGTVRGALVVMTTHGGGSEAGSLGAVTEYVLRQAGVPVLLLRPGKPALFSGHAQRSPAILTALNCSATDAAILAQVVLLSHAMGAHVTLMTVVDPSSPARSPMSDPGDTANLGVRTRRAQLYLDRAADQLRTHGLSVACRVHTSDAAASTLLDELETGRYELLALATGAGSGPESTLGSVAERVIRGASKPVLAVRGTQAAVAV